MALRPARALDKHCDRSLRDHLDRHHRAEDPSLAPQAIAEALIQWLGQFPRCGLHEAGPVAATSIAVEGELAHAERLSRPKRLVHAALVVAEDSQGTHLVGEPVGAVRRVAAADPKQN